MAKGTPKYHDEADTEYNFRLNDLVKGLPPYCRMFFNAKRTHHQVRTLIGYAYDLKTFFYYLTQMNPLCKDKAINEIPFSLLSEIGVHDIEEYGVFLMQYTLSGTIMKNGPLAIRRKMSSLSSFFDYFRKNEELPKNPVEKYERPSLPSDTTITTLDDDEVDTLLNALETQSVWRGRQLCYHAKTKNRDYALYTTLLGTGIRVSELISLNVEDIDFSHLEFTTIRKGNKKQQIWMSEEVADALSFYIEHERDSLLKDPSESAVFISLQGRRLTARQVEKMTENLAAVLFPYKHITPHKLRSTYGTSLYRETEDIYAVASTLGHTSVETTRKHYARQDMEKIRRISIDHSLHGKMTEEDGDGSEG